MVRDRVRVEVIVSVWVRCRVGIWDTFGLLFRVRVDVISFRIGRMFKFACAFGLQKREGLAHERNMCVCFCVFECLRECVYV